MALADTRGSRADEVQVSRTVLEFRLGWRDSFENRALNELHAEAFAHAVLDDDWVAQVSKHSLGWICAWSEAAELIGFVNIPWDGGVHAFVVDTIVSTNARRRGLGKAMMKLAAEQAHEAGCEWLHVDFEDDLGPFYFGACDFAPTNAGLIQLKELRLATSANTAPRAGG